MTYDVVRHVRQWPHDQENFGSRGANGHFLPVLPEFQRQPKGFYDVHCAVCLRRRGQHRYGDEACMNPAWEPGNGHPQYRDGSTFLPPLVEPLRRGGASK